MRIAPGGRGMSLRSQVDNSLTSFEVEGLRGDLTLADGHAGHEWKNVETAFRRDTLFPEARSRGPIPTALDMMTQWSLLVGEPSAPHTDHMIALTASISIDIVAASAETLGKRVILVDPTFDNLSQILLRRGVVVAGVFEQRLHDDPHGVVEVLGQDDAILLVHPNNPTGAAFDDETLDAIFAACARRGVTIILDCTFRSFAPPGRSDILGRLRRSGVEFVVIEDTGKTWSTLEIKASPIFYSPGWKAAIETVFSEIFLLQSPWIMQAFADLFRLERATGFPRPLNALVEARRSRLRDLLARTRVRVAPESFTSGLPVEWLDISATGMTDIALVSRIAAQTGVQLLPGQPFYWSRGDLQPQNRIRVSLLRQQQVFDEALARLEAWFEGGL